MGIRCADHVTPLYPQKLALTSPTGGGRSVSSIVRSRTKATESKPFNKFEVDEGGQTDERGVRISITRANAQGRCADILWVLCDYTQQQNCVRLDITAVGCDKILSADLPYHFIVLELKSGFSGTCFFFFPT